MKLNIYLGFAFIALPIILIFCSFVAIKRTSDSAANTLRVEYLSIVNLGFLKNQLQNANVQKEKQESLTSLLEMLNDVVQKDIYYLNYNSGMSLFYHDTTIIEGDKYNQLSSTTNPTMLYKDHYSSETFQIDTIAARGILCKNPMFSPSDWKIYNNRDTTILGYKCLFAEFLKNPEDKISAWFTPEIPIKDGPSAFCGLPGLILKVDMVRSSFIASKLTLNAKIKDICLPEHYQLMNGVEYEQLLRGMPRKGKTTKN